MALALPVSESVEASRRKADRWVRFGLQGWRLVPRLTMTNQCVLLESFCPLSSAGLATSAFESPFSRNVSSVAVDVGDGDVGEEGSEDPE